MSWAKSTKRLMAAVAVLAAAAVPGAALAGIVVASSGPSAASYPPGKKLPDDAKITLKAADTITILDSKGTRVLRGAGTFTVGAPGTYALSAQFALLTRERSAKRVRTGATRGDMGPPARTNLWYVDATTAGTVCIVNPADIRVWRPEQDGLANYRVASANGKQTTTIAFTDGVTVAPWDVTAAPVTDGASFTITGKDAAQPVTVTFATLPQQEYTPEDLAAALMAKGCTAQVELLANTLALPDDTQTTM